MLKFYFAFISSLLCFYVNWNVFLTNIRHVFLGAQRDRLSEMVLLSTHNICFSHQYIACVEGAQKDRLIETVLLSTYSKCFWMRIKMEKMAVLFFAPYLGFRLSPKSLETSHHGGQGLFEPRLSHLFEFRSFVPLDRSK